MYRQRITAFTKLSILNDKHISENQNLKNRKLKRKRKQKRKRGSLREVREAPPRRCPHPFRFCFRFRFNFRFFKFLFSYVYVLIFNRPVLTTMVHCKSASTKSQSSLQERREAPPRTGRLNINTYT